MENNEIIKVKGRFVRLVYPKSSIFSFAKNGDSTYGVVVWEVLEGNENVKQNYCREITIKGYYEGGIKPDSDYNLLIKEEDHEKYGQQYKLQYYNEEIDFKNINNQKGFLLSFLTEQQVKDIFDTYENPIEIIANRDIEALKKVRNIGEFRANHIIEEFDKVKDYSVVYAELDKLGLTSNFINKMIATYKNPNKVIKVAKETPYQMINDIDGVGFATADKVALNGGLPFNSEERIKHYILFYLNELGEKDGHSYATSRQLNENIFNTLGDREELLVYYDENDKTNNNINNAIKDLEKNKIIKLETNKDKNARRIYLMKYYNLEKEIAFNLKRLKEGKSYFHFEDVDEKIKQAEEKQGFEFTDEQKNGIKLGLENQVCLITGGAGSGKTSVLTGILSVLDNYTFAQTALSGQAAARMQEVTGEKGQTIHRLLGYNPATGGFLYNEKNPLNYDIIILDEVSLVGGRIFLDLLKAIPTGAKFYMLGDPGQLEAIGPLNLAADMIKSKELENVVLTKVHRQAQKSGILTTAYDVRKGIQVIQEYDFEGTEVKGELQDMILEITDSRDRDSDLVLTYFEKYFNSDLVNKDIMKIQAIAPIKERGDCCVMKLNNRIQDLVNPKGPYDRFVPVKRKKGEDGEERGYDIRINDKVMCVKNNYKALATEDGGVVTSIFNGWVGTVLDITFQFVIINFPLASYDKIYIPIKEVGSYITLGYCSTVHKLQGSSADVIIGVVDYSTPPQMLTRQLVYTLLTRARKLCVLVAQNTALRKAIATNFVSEKKTFLPEFLVKTRKELQE